MITGSGSLLWKTGAARTYCGRDGSPYLTRISLTPETRWGRLMLQIFHRGDPDPDPHDHPWDFWTFPLVGYVEEVMKGDGSIIWPVLVDHWQWHYRPCYYAHRVLYAQWSSRRPRNLTRRIVSIVWRGPYVRDWGFWVEDGLNEKERALAQGYGAARRGRRRFMHWKRYLHQERPGEV